MQIDNSLLERMPFPCFVIDNDYRILFSSSISTQYFPQTDLFMNLVEQSKQSVFKDYLLHSKEFTAVDLPLYVKGNKDIAFQVYKQKSKNNETEIFCIPKEPIEFEIHPEFSKAVEEEKASKNGVITTNNHYILETVEDNEQTEHQTDQLATIGQLAAGVAHEIRNPLTTVKGFIQLIKPYLSEFGKEDYALIALDEINRANEIIHDFLTAAKPKSRENSRQFIEANQLINSIVLLYESEVILRNLEFEVIHNCKDAVLYLDIKQIKQVLVNIIKNAIEAIEEKTDREKGIIRIRTESINNYAVILIEDNGIGMCAETLNKLFVPFFSTKEQGTGIGMTVCKNIIENHLGKIYVSSKYNHGTTFRIELPIYQKEDIKLY